MKIKLNETDLNLIKDDESIKVFKALKSILNLGYKIVDLGLPSGTLWADKNIGANNIEDYGQYFMHGDTEGYNEDDGIKCTGNYSNNKWDGTYGCVKGAYYPYNANNPNLPIAFDSARKKLGNEWEMPTEEQLEELLDNNYTTKSFEKLNGVYGLLITSIENGNSIFLPAAGYISSTGIGGRTSSGCYWSKNMISQTSAVMLDFDSGGNSTSSQSRQYGCSIRAVINP